MVSYSGVEAIFRLTPLQESMLFHVAKDNSAYITQLVREGDLSTFDYEKFAIAVRKVVEKHSAFRTRYVSEGVSNPIQIILGLQSGGDIIRRAGPTETIDEILTADKGIRSFV